MDLSVENGPLLIGIIGSVASIVGLAVAIFEAKYVKQSLRFAAKIFLKNSQSSRELAGFLLICEQQIEWLRQMFFSLIVLFIPLATIDFIFHFVEMQMKGAGLNSIQLWFWDISILYLCFFGLAVFLILPIIILLVAIMTMLFYRAGLLSRLNLVEQEKSLLEEMGIWSDQLPALANELAIVETVETADENQKSTPKKSEDG